MWYTKLIVFSKRGNAVLNINIDGLNINYVCEGSGDDVVLLHGWGSNINLFAGIVNTLSPHYRVIAPDMPGFGESDAPKEAWCVDDYVDFVIKFLQKFGIKKAVFLGHSFGGRVIIKMFARRNLPFEITKVILADSAGVLPKKTLKQKTKIRMFKCGKKILSLKPVAALFPDALENFRSKSGSADYNAASPVMRQTLVRVVNEDLTHIFKDVNVPVLLIWGRDDTATPVSDAELMERLMPDAGKVVFDNCGHYSFIDKAYEFNRVLASFMNIL